MLIKCGIGIQILSPLQSWPTFHWKRFRGGVLSVFVNGEEEEKVGINNCVKMSRGDPCVSPCWREAVVRSGGEFPPVLCWLTSNPQARVVGRGESTGWECDRG